MHFDELINNNVPSISRNVQNSCIYCSKGVMLLLCLDYSIMERKCPFLFTNVYNSHYDYVGGAYAPIVIQSDNTRRQGAVGGI